MIRVGIVGGTGYTGVELLRLLAAHPQAEVITITSRGEEGRSVTELFPSLRGHYDLRFRHPEPALLQGCDVVFFATPHGVAQSMVDEVAGDSLRIIDLSADFRLRDISLWEQWYGQGHQAPHWAERAVYGLPELNREAIRSAQLVACPGCYPTAVLLGFFPLLARALVRPDSLIANCASGITGAGRQAKVELALAENADSFRAYGVAGHRHLPEILQQLRIMQDGDGAEVDCTFVPHLLPIIRGIHATLYADLLDEAVDVQAIFEEQYRHEPFVDVLPPGQCPETRSVRGTNTCRIAVHRPQNGRRLVVTAVEDNLTKGAAGQAIQNMNIMFGLDETLGLQLPALSP